MPVARASAADLRAGAAARPVRAPRVAKLVPVGKAPVGRVARAARVLRAVKPVPVGQPARALLVARVVQAVGAAAPSRWRARANPRF